MLRSWGSIITISCIVIAAIFEAVEQALASSPRTAAHLPDFHGWGNYVPLILLCIAVVTWIAGRFKKVSKPTQLALASNPLSRAIPHEPGTFDSKDFFRTAYYSTLQDTAANSFRVEAERARPDDRESFYVDVLAVGSLAVFYDRIWYPLYRSQLRALLALNKQNGIAPLSMIKRFYDDAAKEFPKNYETITFDEWLKYLTQNTLLMVHPSKMVEITVQGKDFLKYLLHWGRSEETKRL